VKLRFLADAMGHVKVLISKVLIEVDKVMVAVIEGLKWKRVVLQAMKMGGTGFFLCAGCLASCSNDLGICDGAPRVQSCVF
jgi:hypothetical protein